MYTYREYNDVEVKRNIQLNCYFSQMRTKKNDGKRTIEEKHPTKQPKKKRAQEMSIVQQRLER
jgi:hypothetical protein